MNSRRHSISVIVPAFNTAETLGGVLQSLCAKKDDTTEVIVVDDHSEDTTAQVAKQFPVDLITMPLNSGPSAARNAGARHSNGSLLVFLDADVVLPSNAIDTIRSAFSRYPSLGAVVGVFAITQHQKGLVPCYKHLHVCYSYLSCGPWIRWLNTSITAMPRDLFFQLGGFNERLRFGEDWELGERIAETGRRIYLDKSLQVEHIKRRTFIGMLRNDFRSSISDIRLMFEHYLMSSKKCQCGSLPKEFLSETIAAIICLLLLITSIIRWDSLMLWTLAIAAWLSFIWSGRRFWLFIAKHHSVFVIPSLMAIVLIHRLVVSFGASVGLTKWLRNSWKQFLGKNSGTFMQFIEYGIAGGIATVVHIGIFYFLASRIIPALADDDIVVSILKVPVKVVDDAVRAKNSMIVNGIAFIISVLVAYMINVFWVFKSGRYNRFVEVGMFYLACGISEIFATFLMGALIAYLGINTTSAFCVSIFCAVIIGYTLKKHVVFEK